MKKLIFDFDGTLVDSMPHYCRIMLNVLDRRQISYPRDIMRVITPLGYLGTAEYFVAAFGLEDRIDTLLNEMNTTALKLYRDIIPAKERVADTLRELKNRGFSLNVLTASPHIMLDPCLKRLGLWELFDNIWSCDDFSTTKSDPHIYEAVAECLDAELSACCFFDDNLNALTTAAAAGMNVVGVWDDSSQSDTEEIKNISSAYIISFRELLLEQNLELLCS